MVRFVAALLVVAVFVTGVDAAEPGVAPQNEPRGLVLGLTGTELAIASSVGLGIGAAAAFARSGRLAALVRGGTLAGLSLTTLVGLYVAHLFVEAVLVGGVYYYWPSERSADDQPSRSMKLRLDPSPRKPPDPPGIAANPR
jgi:hypothetical protein